jgi:hypothetical protein
VQPGLAVNREGLAMELPVSIEVSLAPLVEHRGSSQTSFSPCTSLPPGASPSRAGVYLLSLAPTFQAQGLAPASGLGNTIAACNTNVTREGVEFRLLPLTVPSGELADTAHLRNRLANEMFGTEDPRRWATQLDPFGSRGASYGLFDELEQTCLTAEQVALCLVFWTLEGGIVFLDHWSVRRRVTAPDSSPRWATLLGDRVKSEAQARFLQFQAQVEELAGAGGSLQGLAAADRFSYLPPVGMLPVAGPGSSAGFSVSTFFGAQASSEVATTNANLVPTLLEESLSHAPLRVGPNQEKVQLYWIYENLLASSSSGVQLAVVFAKGTLPYRGVARFGFAHWGISRPAPEVI